MKRVLFSIILFNVLSQASAQEEQSVARLWNEVLLEGIRNDLARPTIHARNLFHISAAMYDAWSAYDPKATPYFLGQTVADFHIPFDERDISGGQPEQEQALSYAVYRLIEHRFRNSPGFEQTLQLANQLMSDLGYDFNYFDTDYINGSAAALGNYLADRIIAFGFQDGANELGAYANQYYEPINDPLPLVAGGQNILTDPNRWQPLEFDESFIDQSGNVINKGSIPFLSPEWGNVVPFSFSPEDLHTFARGENAYYVYDDPGNPPFIDSLNGIGIEDPYKWGFSLVAIWSSHLDPTDGVSVDISPASVGNIALEAYPLHYDDYDQFYELIQGGDISSGYELNPKTGKPYESQWVPRGDYARVLAEFWADGPDSETPPGHWFTILNYVNDHPLFEKRFNGQGEILDPLEWDVKCYFTLGGAMHDAALAAWSIKGYYDYVRPISAIRYMATMGQSTDPTLHNYHKEGIPLVPGQIELIEEGDPLVGDQNEFLYEIKLKAWRGHDYIEDATTDTAGVGWIKAYDWWPYQRPSFVTPPFAGFVSGHSTFSRAAAEVLTLLTGDEYFPGGMGEFHAPQNDFLVFERGPSVDITLQWAKYYDASDQCSLSRIWGGIHPPADDIPGRKIGMEIGKKSFAFAKNYFESGLLSAISDHNPSFHVFPNPVSDKLLIKGIDSGTKVTIRSLGGQRIFEAEYTNDGFDLKDLERGLYIISTDNFSQKLLVD